LTTIAVPPYVSIPSVELEYYTIYLQGPQITGLTCLLFVALTKCGDGDGDLVARQIPLVVAAVVVDHQILVVGPVQIPTISRLLATNHRDRSVVVAAAVVDRQILAVGPVQIPIISRLLAPSHRRLAVDRQILVAVVVVVVVAPDVRIPTVSRLLATSHRYRSVVAAAVAAVVDRQIPTIAHLLAPILRRLAAVGYGPSRVFQLLERRVLPPNR